MKKLAYLALGIVFLTMSAVNAQTIEQKNDKAAVGNGSALDVVSVTAARSTIIPLQFGNFFVNPGERLNFNFFAVDDGSQSATLSYLPSIPTVLDGKVFEPRAIDIDILGSGGPAINITRIEVRNVNGTGGFETILDVQGDHLERGYYVFDTIRPLDEDEFLQMSFTVEAVVEEPWDYFQFYVEKLSILGRSQ